MAAPHRTGRGDCTRMGWGESRHSSCENSPLEQSEATLACRKGKPGHHRSQSSIYPLRKLLLNAELENEAAAAMQATLQDGETPIAWIDIGVYQLGTSLVARARIGRARPRLLILLKALRLYLRCLLILLLLHLQMAVHRERSDVADKRAPLNADVGHSRIRLRLQEGQEQGHERQCSLVKIAAESCGGGQM